MEFCENIKVHYHLPGLFEFYDFYKIFLKVFFDHREYFYQWCDIGSIYGAPSDCLWGGGRTGFGNCTAENALSLMKKYNISSRLTFSNSLIKKEHLSDKKCNELCKMFESENCLKNGIIIYSDLLMDYIKEKYPDFYFVSSTTKVITDFNQLIQELNRDDFAFVVPDFRFNNDFKKLTRINTKQKEKMEFLCNECCWIGCKDRKNCYENVSKKNIGESCTDFECKAPGGIKGYSFAAAKKNPSFISVKDIQEKYIPEGFKNFKIEGRNLGSAMLLEFLLYYLTKEEYQLDVREAVYLDNQLDLF